MKSRPKNRGLAYYRRSDDKQEASLAQQHGWAREHADKLGVAFEGTLADVTRLQEQRRVQEQRQELLPLFYRKQPEQQQR